MGPGEPIIVWPPDGGNYNYSDSYTSVCVTEIGSPWVDCTDQYDAAYGGDDSGLVCCFEGFF